MIAASAGIERLRADGPAVWIDVEDFVEYFDHNAKPSGIQRLLFELMQALAAGPQAAAIRFVRRGPVAALRGSVVEVPAAEVWQTFHCPPGRIPPPPPVRRMRLPPMPATLQEPLHRARLLQDEAHNSFRELVRLARRPREPEVDAVQAPIRPGDWLLELGAPWAVADSPEWLAAVKQRHGVRLGLLIYDLVPYRHPEWCVPELVERFEYWLGATLPQCDHVMALSQHTAGDLLAYARERGIDLPGTVAPIPVGTGFSKGTEAEQDAPGWLPPPGSYVLFVSTLEARKNHALAVRIWRRLSEEVRTGVRGPESLPQLVFAGRVGWLVADLMQQLENASWLRGRVRLIREPTDAELRRLYEGCLFTLFPSWFEGWGLPVTESLAVGKPCLSSDAAALPEAGGGLARYFDPADVNAAHRAVAALLDDRPGIAAWEAQVRREFRPTPWSETAASVLGRLDGVCR